MNKKLKLCLALFMALAVLVQYSFTPQALVAYGLNNTDNAVQTEEAAGDDGQAADEQKATEATEPTDATEAAKPAGEDKEPAADKQDVNYPAAQFSEKAGDVTVNITAPEGALPEGTTVKVETVDTSEVEKAVEKLYEDATVVKAVDITFKNKDGKEIEPNEKVSVTFASKAFGKLDDAAVVHINDKGKAEEVEKAKVDADKKQASFRADEFSIYAVVSTGSDARIKVIFKNGDTEVGSMYVKSGDNMQQVLYDPGAGTVPEGAYFRGWTTVKDYTTETEALSISDVRTAVSGMLPPATDGTVVTYYAMLFKDYRITYLDEKGISLGQEEVTFRADAVNPQQSYTVNMAYTVQSDTEHFEGWKVNEGGSNIAGHTDGKIYPNNTEISITGDVTFGVNAPKGHWFIFDENGKGATYNAPQFVYSSDKPTRPNDNNMIRNGYTFGGWFKDKAVADQTSGGTQYNFNQTLTDKVTVYARWIPNETADYTIIIWKQNLAGDGYDFAEAITVRNATVGSNITAVTGTVGDQNARVNGANKGWTGFHYQSNDQEGKTVATEGNTVVNVYFDRNEHTLSFIDGEGSVTFIRNNGNSQTNPIGDQITNNLNDYENNKKTISGHEVSYRSGYYSTTYAIKINGNWYRIDGNNPSRIWDARSITSVSNGTVKTITALYGQSIGDNFPIVGTNGRTYDQGERWMPQNSSTYHDVLVYIDIMPNESVTFRLDEASHTTKHIYYYVETLPGQDAERTYNGKDFVLHKSVAANYGFFTEAEDYLDFVGFTKYGYTPNNAWGSGGANNVYCYYTRNVYPINFMDGKYIDGDNNPLEESGMGQIGTKTGIAYGADVSSNNDYKPDAAHTPAGYVFEGWYIDSACTTPFTFNKMPEGGITVYAKWRQKQYRVFLHPNYPEGATGHIDWGTANQQMCFRESEGGHVSEPTGRLAGFEFVGWYLDAACTEVFNGDAYTINETNVTTPYDKTVDMTDTYDVDGNLIDPKKNSDLTGYNGSDRFWITKKLDIYAKWRSTLEGASGIVVEYDANGGTGAPTDTHTYVDGAKAPAGAASKSTDAKKVFSHWAVQKWNGTEWVDTGDKVLPGKTFTVLAANAKVEDIVNPQPGGDTKKYTVRLKAVYIDSEEPTPTHIYWYKNDGSDAYVKENNAAINVGVDIPAAPTREGYTFLGWSRVEIGNTQEAASAWEANSANWKQNLTASNLYLYYAEDDSTYHLNSVTGTAVTQVAPDEKTPYHAMFAVWESNPDELTYNANGGSGTMEPSSGRVDETVVVKTNGFTVKPGCIFDGWNTEANGSGTGYSPGDNYVLTAGNDVLYAQWTPDPAQTYTVTYNAQTGGSVDPTENEDLQVLSNEGVTGSTATAAAGYKFDGWYKGGTKISDELTLSASDAKENLNKDGDIYANTTYTAHFSVDPDQTYTVTYNAQTGGSVDPANQSDQVLSNAAITGSTATAKTGYKFDGWYKGDTKISDAAALPASVAKANLNKDGDIYANTTYTAHFSVDPDQTYTVTYSAQTGGSVDPASQSDQVLSNTAITGSTATAKKGYKFDGWYKGDNLISADEALSDTIAKAQLNTGADNTYADTTYTAKFVKDDEQTYNVSYAAEEGGSVDPTANENIHVLSTEGVTGSTATAAPGYKFDGWYKGEAKITGNATLSEGDAKANLNTGEDDTYANTTYTAHFSADPAQTYTVTYNAQTGGSVDPTENEDLQVLSNEGVTGSTATAAAGYKFDGWYKGGTKISDELTLSASVAKENLNKDGDIYANTTYTAHFSVDPDQTYTVTYNAQTGGSVDPANQSDQVLSNAAITGSTATAKTGYKFDGWYKGDTKISDAAALPASVAKANLNKDGDIYANTTYTAHFSVDPDQTYTVTYSAQTGGSVDPASQSDQVLSNTAITGSTATAKKGYKFDGWYKGDNLISADEALSDTIAKAQLNTGADNTYADTTYTAKFVKDDEQTYNVSYAAEEGGSVDPTANENIHVLSTEGVTGSTATAAPGYKFDGWYKGEAKITGNATLSEGDAKANLNTGEDDTYANTTYTAHFSADPAQTYTVTYNAQTGGSVDPTENEDLQVLSNEGVTGSTATAAAGYKFDGWYKGGTKISDELTLSASDAKENLNKDGDIYANTTYTAHFSVDPDQTYTVTYNAQTGGSVDPANQSDQVLSNAAITGSTATAKTGYKFDGWYKGDTKISDAAALPASVAKANLNKDGDIYANTTYTAHFSVDPDQTYTVTYSAQTGGSVDPASQSDQVLSNTAITGSTATAKKGYKFDGWYKGDNLISADEALSDTIAKAQLNTGADNTYADTTYTAKFVKDDEQTYNVSYAAEEGGSVDPTANENIHVLSTEGVTGSTATAAPGYKFDGWYKGEAKITGNATLSEGDAKANLNTGEDDTYANTTYTAHFSADPAQTYTVTYNAQTGGSVDPANQSDQVLSNAAITGSTATAAAGYEFDGWYKGDTKISDAAALPASVAKASLNKDGNTYADTTYTAKFNAIVEVIVEGKTKDDAVYNGETQTYSEYTVTYKIAGEVVSEQKLPKEITVDKQVTSAAGKDASDEYYTGSVQITIALADGATGYVISESVVSDVIKLKINRKDATIIANDNSKIYGDADPTLTATEDGLIGEDKIPYSVIREAGEDVGSYVITFDFSSDVEGSSLRDFMHVIGLADQKKPIGNYEVTFIDGTFTITPATLTITTPSARKVYDGTALTNANATITGLKNGDKATVTATGSQTNPGSSRNTYRINWGDTDPKNYTLKENFGTLTVTAAPTPTPTPAPGPGPGVGPAPAPAAPAQVVVDNPTPTTVIDEPAPKAVTDYWALINLLCAIATALLSLIMLIRFFGKRRYEEEVMDPATGQTVTRDVDEQRKGFARIASLIPAIGAIIAFIVTEDMSLPMAMVDKWTILMVVILAIQAGVGIFAKLRDNDEEEEDDEAMA